MNPKINQAMEANKIFQYKGKFFRKTVEGHIQEMQQVKSEEIVAKGSRKFLRTIMKFIPKKIYMGNVPGSCPIPPEALRGLDAPKNMQVVGDEMMENFAENGENQVKEQKTGTQGVQGNPGKFEDFGNPEENKKTSLTEDQIAEKSNSVEYNDQLENNKTSLKLNPQMINEQSKQVKAEREIEENILNDHQEWFKSAQSIYNTEKIPSKNEEERNPQEPIAEIETDFQRRESKSSGEDVLFENLNDVYGEDRDVRNEYQFQGGEQQRRETTEESSYVQMPTRGSENLENRFSNPREFNFQKNGEYEGRKKKGLIFRTSRRRRE